MYKRIILPHGLRLILSPSKNTEAVSVYVLAGAGSRYEVRDTSGLAHFLEHMFFKGAKKYPKAKDVSEAIDSIGGEFNAFTDKEYVGYYVKVAHEHVDTAVGVLADMMLHSRLDKNEIERERGVILEEINMYEDSPMSKIDEGFDSLMFGDHPLGWKTAGPREVIKKLTRADFVDYQRRFYTPDNIVISIAGNFSIASMTRLVKKHFRFPKRTKDASFLPHHPFKPKSRVTLITQKTEQAHMHIGVPSFGARDPRRSAGLLLASILGGGMSSRLFLSVRERQGLCYYIASGLTYFTDAGDFDTRAGVDLKRVPQAITAILREYRRMRTEVVSEKELRKAREYIKGQTTLRMEASDEIAEFLGKQELLNNHIDTVSDLFKKLDKVTARDIRALAKELFQTERLRLGLIGPYEKTAPFEKLLVF